jgi:hypothetical protein
LSFFGSPAPQLLRREEEESLLTLGTDLYKQFHLSITAFPPLLRHVLFFSADAKKQKFFAVVFMRFFLCNRKSN